MIVKAANLIIATLMACCSSGTAAASSWIEGEEIYKGTPSRYVFSDQWFASCYYSTFDRIIDCGIKIMLDRVAFDLALIDNDQFEASLDIAGNVLGSEWRARTDDVDAVTYRETVASASDSRELFDSILNGSSFYTTFVHVDDGYVEHHASAEGFPEAVEWIRQRLIEFEAENPGWDSE